jgi:hypothetical protein
MKFYKKTYRKTTSPRQLESFRMLTENDVVQHVVRVLSKNNYSIAESTSTSQHGKI